MAHRVDHGEDGGRQADREREGEDRYQGEAGASPQRAQRVPQIGPEHEGREREARHGVVTASSMDARVATTVTPPASLDAHHALRCRRMARWAFIIGDGGTS
jgi:hypothetical protein